MQRSFGNLSRRGRAAACGLFIAVILIGSMGVSCDKTAFRGALAQSFVERGLLTPVYSIFQAVVYGFWGDDIINWREGREGGGGDDNTRDTGIAL